MWAALAVAVLVVGTFAVAEVLVRSSSSEEAASTGAAPGFLVNAPEPVLEAYAYAVQHPEVLQYIPCYCGCDEVGHTSNVDCFIDQRLPDGRVTYDSMGSA